MRRIIGNSTVDSFFELAAVQAYGGFAHEWRQARESNFY
jgi:hypothetical protein